MANLYKRFVGWVTKWKSNSTIDEFFIARLRLTFYYCITAIVILGGSSIILYNTILSNFTDSIMKERRLDPALSAIIIDRTQDILLNRFLTINILLIFVVVIVGFLLTSRTLAPIKSNMQKQRRFIADASHELRTPIAVIISGLEVNLSNKKLDLPVARKTIEDTLGEMREFSKLSNNLLDLSKYDTQRESKHEPLLIDELLSSILEKNKSLAKLKEITIENNIQSAESRKSGVKILGNKIELARVFYNILDNAIKYTPPHGSIVISDKSTSNAYTVSIADSGVGVSKEIIDKIFDPFFRGDASRSTEGAGLGLTLAKKIIEDHGGTISIKSTEKMGTTVLIMLPIAS